MSLEDVVKALDPSPWGEDAGEDAPPDAVPALGEDRPSVTEVPVDTRAPAPTAKKEAPDRGELKISPAQEKQARAVVAALERAGVPSNASLPALVSAALQEPDKANVELATQVTHLARRLIEEAYDYTAWQPVTELQAERARTTYGGVAVVDRVDLTEGNAAIAAMKRLSGEIATIESQAAAMVRERQHALFRLMDRYKPALRHLVDEIAPKGKKSVKLITGTVRKRKQAEKVVLLDGRALEAWLDALPLEHDVPVDTILKWERKLSRSGSAAFALSEACFITDDGEVHWKATGEAVPGLKHIGSYDKLYVD